MTVRELKAVIKSAGRSFGTGAGPRLAASLLLFAITISAAIVCIIKGAPDLAPPSATARVLTFIIAYWRLHPFDALFSLVVVLGTSVTPLLDRIVYDVVAPEEIDSSDYRRRVVYVGMSAALATATVLLATFALPFFDLQVQSFIRRAVLFVYLASSGIAYYLGFVKPRCRSLKDPLTHLSFGDIPTFNVAAGGASSVEAEQVRRQFATVGDRITPEVQNLFIDGDPGGKWTGLRDFFDHLGRLLEVAPTSIVLQDRTASAIGAAIDYLATDRTVCISTDLDYPTIQATIAQRDNVRHINISCAKEVWTLTMSGRAVADKIAAEIEGRHFHRRRLLVCVPHVAYETGICVDIEALAARLSRLGDVHLIVDGAQAVGNIAVGPSILQGVTFYAFGGHKWLLGEPALGMLYMNPDRLGRPPAEIATALVGSRSFAYCEQDFRAAAADTVSLPPFVTLNVTLVDMLQVGIKKIDAHNTALACLFRELLAPLGVGRLPQYPQHGGIVTMLIPDASVVAKQLALTTSYSAQPLHEDALRFSFHYNIGERDVYNLALALGRIAYQARRKRYD